MASAKQIINVDLKKSLVLDEKILKEILVKDEIKHLPVVVISIVGTYRQGKSFILNFFLRFLNLTCKEKKDVRDWLKPDDGTLTGFVWKNSSERETVGIMMWSEIFISRLPSGEEVGIILLDTQGTYDNQTDLNDFATIFALSTLLSSVQIYNMKDNIKQNDLMSLKDFLDYGQLINDANSSAAPFQNLIFLIRDWVNVNEFEYGEEGGQKYLKKTLDFNPDDAENVTALKKSIQKFFRKTYAFLLPHPGSKVVRTATNKLEEMDTDFILIVKLLVEKILKPENLVVKEINGKKVKISDFCILIEKYYEEFQSGKMPKVQSIFQATAEVQHLSALEDCVKLYQDWLSYDKNPETQSEDDTILKIRHEEKKKLALEEFARIRKMGDEETTQKYRTQLAGNIDHIFSLYDNLNQMKLQREQQVRDKEEIIKKNQEQEEVNNLLREKLKNAEVHSEKDREEKEKMEQKLREQEQETKENERKILELENSHQTLSLFLETAIKAVEVGSRLGEKYIDNKTKVKVAKIHAQGKSNTSSSGSLSD